MVRNGHHTLIIPVEQRNKFFKRIDVEAEPRPSRCQVGFADKPGTHGRAGKVKKNKDIDVGEQQDR